MRRLRGNNDNLWTTFCLCLVKGHQSGHIDEIPAPPPSARAHHDHPGTGNGHWGAPFPGRRDARQVCGQRVSSAVAGRQGERVPATDVGAPGDDALRWVTVAELSRVHFFFHCHSNCLPERVFDCSVDLSVRSAAMVTVRITASVFVSLLLLLWPVFW